MTRAEAAPSSVAEAARDKHSRSQPAGSSGPNKDSQSHPGGAAALGVEIGGEADARREREDAIAQGDSLPPQSTARSTAGDLGIGQLNGQDAGVSSLPSQGQRDQDQQTRNQNYHGSGQPDLATIAKTSAASGAHNSQVGDTTSSAATNPSELLGQVGASSGQPSGTNSFNGEVARDAPTNF